MNRQKKIWEYLRDGRNGKEANRLEQDALSDPFLYEALEGLMSTEAGHEEIVGNLTKQLRGDRTLRKKNHFSFWWSAASFLLIGGVAFWLLRSPEEPVQLAVIPQVADSLEIFVPEVSEEPGTDSETLQQAGFTDVTLADEPIAQKKARERVVVMSSPVTGSGSERLRKQRIVQGAVLDNHGSPLPGATVMAGRKGAVTDEHGRFRLEVEDSSRQLVASFIGMKPQHYTLSDKKEVRITLTEDSQRLNEVVVTGWTEKRKETFTASTISVRNGTEEQASFNRYAADSLRYPEDAVRQRIQGEVALSLYFNRKGKLGRIKVVQKLFPSCDREAVRLVEQYPGPWNIKKQSITVRVPFKLR